MIERRRVCFRPIPFTYLLFDLREVIIFFNYHLL